MSVGGVVDLIVTMLAAGLVGVIGYLGKGRLDAQDRAAGDLAGKVDGMDTRVRQVERDVVQLTEAQRSVVANQTAASHAQQQLLTDSDELEDKISELDRLTGRLYDQLREHRQYVATLRDELLGRR